ncbi:MAG: thioesterase family protein [Bacteroidales bacterium]|nr:thioesterase family protein [Bacteroidales bacterium]
MNTIKTTTKVRVRYADTDKMGVVYYSNYAVFYEVGRTEMFRELGIPYSLLEERGVALPVVELVSHYHKSARYDDLITVETSVETLPTVKIKINYRILSEDGVLLNDGSTTLVFVDIKTGRPVRCPKDVLDVLEKSSKIPGE